MWKCFALVLILFSSTPVRAEERVVVLELFTSQSCPNCPPAIEILNGLSDKPNLLALNWAVDYWDFLGWKDSFALKSFADLQRAYNKRLGEPGVYTPQLIVDGSAETVGSRRAEIEELMRESKQSRKAYFDVALSHGDEALDVYLPKQEMKEDTVHVKAVFFRGEQDVMVQRGPNRGLHMRYSNVVKDVMPLGMWTGDEQRFRIPMSEIYDAQADNVAVLLHLEKASGVIVGAARMALMPH